MSNIVPGDMVTMDTHRRGWAALNRGSGPTGELVNVFNNAEHKVFVLAVVWLYDRSACYAFVRGDRDQAWFPIEELVLDEGFR